METENLPAQAGGEAATLAPPNSETDSEAVQATLAPGNAQVATDDQAGQATLPPSTPSAAFSGVADTLPFSGERPDVGATLPLEEGRTLNSQEAETQAFHRKAIAAVGAFGDYQLLEPIAKGGMGIVYKAKQKKLNRIVAIKMILAGQFADQSDIDRFYAEAEAAAALSHPNIVPIYEIGEFEGQHFFSMDYVTGGSLSSLVRENPLPPRRAAELLRTIAEAMQFAHDSGIVHRDLKPGNVLLDKNKRPLVTDFGLAKHVSNQSNLTMAGSIIGTPSYMPPEQAAGKLDEVGPWSDLYSLGAILYEMLTGRPPFRAATPFETIRHVLELEPPSPRLLNPQVPKDLETICLKCLQKSRTNRYASAQELADELTRFIKGEPIHARPISKLARFWRLCQRHPITASSIAAAVLILISATCFSTFFFVRASIKRDEAQRRLNDTRQVVDNFLTRFSEEALLRQPGMQRVRDELLQEALTVYQGILKDSANDPSVQDQLAKAYFRVGQITGLLNSPDEALPSFVKARELQVRLVESRPDDPGRLEALGNTLVAMGTIWVKKRNYDAGRVEYEEAVEVRKKLAALQPANVEYQRLLASTYMNLGLVEYNAALTSADDVQIKKGLDKSRPHYEEAQRIRRTALEIDPANVKLRRDLGKGYYNLGRLFFEEQYIAETEEGLQETLAKAEDNFKKGAVEFEKVVADPTSDLDDRMQVALCSALVGDLLRTSQQWNEARPWYQKALEQIEPLAQQNPAVIDYQTERAALLMSTFELEQAAGNSVAAQAALEHARDIFRKLATSFSDVPNHQRDLAVALRELAKQKRKAADELGATKDFDEALAILSELVNNYPQDIEFARQLEETRASASSP